MHMPTHHGMMCHVALVHSSSHGGITILEDTKRDSPSAVCASVLGEVVGPGELLTTILALEWLFLRVEGAVVALQMLLTTEAAVAQLTYKSLGWVFGQRLLSATTVSGGRSAHSVPGISTRGRVGLRIVLGFLVVARLGVGWRLLAGATRLRVGSGVHDGSASAVGLLLTLVFVGVRVVVTRVGWAGHAADRGLETSGVFKLVFGVA